MKKIILSSILLALSLNTYAFQKERFEQDTKFYHFAQGKAKSIIKLLSSFEEENAIKEAFDLYLQGDPSKWKPMIENLNKAREKANELLEYGGMFNYFSDCSLAVTGADMMWDKGANMRRNPEEWNDPESYNYKQYKAAKADFEKSLKICKSQSENPPNKKDYERELVTFGPSS